MLPSDQKRVTEQAKFTYSPLEKAFEKQAKAIKHQGKKVNKSNWRSWIVESNETVKKDFRIGEKHITFRTKEKIPWNEIKEKIILIIWHIGTKLKKEVQNILVIIKIR